MGKGRLKFLWSEPVRLTLLRAMRDGSKRLRPRARMSKGLEVSCTECLGTRHAVTRHGAGISDGEIPAESFSCQQTAPIVVSTRYHLATMALDPQVAHHGQTLASPGLGCGKNFLRERLYRGRVGLPGAVLAILSITVSCGGASAVRSPALDKPKVSPATERQRLLGAVGGFLMKAEALTWLIQGQALREARVILRSERARTLKLTGGSTQGEERLRQHLRMQRSAQLRGMAQRLIEMTDSGTSDLLRDTAKRLAVEPTTLRICAGFRHADIGLASAWEPSRHRESGSRRITLSWDQGGA